MNDNTESGGRPLTAVLHQMQSEGLIRSYVDDGGHLRWAITNLGRTFQELVAESADQTLPPVSSLFDVGSTTMVEEVVSPDMSGKLVVDIGPAVRIYLGNNAVPDHVDLGLLNLVIDEPHFLEEVTPAYPQRVRMDVGMNRTRPRSKVTKAEFEMVGCSVEFAGLFDLEGRLRCFSPLVQWGEGECRAARWTVCPTTSSQELGA